MTRTATLAKNDASSGNTIIENVENVEYIDPKLLDDVNNYTNSLCPDTPLKMKPKTKPPPSRGRSARRSNNEGGSNIHRKTRKTNKKRKRGQRKTMKKHFKKRKTKKIRTRV